MTTKSFLYKGDFTLVVNAKKPLSEKEEERLHNAISDALHDIYKDFKGAEFDSLTTGYEYELQTQETGEP